MKKHLIYFILLLISAILILSCSLSRNNPLDPIGNPDVFAPPVVQIDTLNTDPDLIKWYVAITKEDSLADGYYIYAAFQDNYFGTYDRVDRNISAHDTTFSKNDVSHEYIWFKITSYNIFNGDTLEGKFSQIAQ
ncbi:MAG: hypothetical protein B1H05_05505 [Candidatus Cloacimonas sp. 4484_140]|nr:MAG: hypothetical protein B1H05_05505 [Candidatus Cloacimonas sp. 4484_140]